jgi:hypothetical protein
MDDKLNDNAEPQAIGRNTLKRYFQNGKFPTQQDYSDLINSMVHKVEDGFSKDAANGLKIRAAGGTKNFCNLISFYKDDNNKTPFFVMAKNQGDPDALIMRPAQVDISSGGDDAAAIDANTLFFHTTGNVGVGKKCADKIKIDVNGFVGMTGRVGNFNGGGTDESAVIADSGWKPIVQGLKGANAFEVIARVGLPHSGKHAILHATALCLYDPKGGKIHKTSAYYGGLWNFWRQLDLKWAGDHNSYELQIRTRSNYAFKSKSTKASDEPVDVNIYYRLTHLWSDESFWGDYQAPKL